MKKLQSNTIDIFVHNFQGCTNDTMYVLPQKTLLSVGVNQTLMRLAPLLQNIDAARPAVPEDPF